MSGARKQKDYTPTAEQRDYLTLRRIIVTRCRPKELGATNGLIPLGSPPTPKDQFTRRPIASHYPARSGPARRLLLMIHEALLGQVAPAVSAPNADIRSLQSLLDLTERVRWPTPVGDFIQEFAGPFDSGVELAVYVKP
jgi:hypothetical protein